MLTISPDPDRRGGFVLHASAMVRRPLDEVFPFFSDARNLEQITPDDMGFRVLTPGPLEMRVGLLIDYRVKAFGLPMRWRSEITRWEPRECFVDVQRKGPFRYWEHLHTFEEVSLDGEPGVRLGDEVHYAVPGGSLVHRLLVRGLNERVFRYRAEVMDRLFGPLVPQ